MVNDQCGGHILKGVFAFFRNNVPRRIADEHKIMIAERFAHHVLFGQYVRILRLVREISQGTDDVVAWVGDEIRPIQKADRAMHRPQQHAHVVEQDQIVRRIDKDQDMVRLYEPSVDEDPHRRVTPHMLVLFRR